MRDKKHLCPKWARILLRKKPPLLDKGGSVVDFFSWAENNQLLNATLFAWCCPEDSDLCYNDTTRGAESILKRKDVLPEQQRVPSSPEP